MARGIDTAAHLGALPRPTIAVLGGGADVIYPPENAALHAEIRRVGAVIAALPLGVTPQARHFPRRNRLISWLSLGVAVVEAATLSGSLITSSEVHTYELQSLFRISYAVFCLKKNRAP